MSEAIKISAQIAATPDQVWDYYTDAAHIVHWNAASPDWHTPRSESDPQNGGRFVHRMEARDGSFGFDFGGTYTELVKPEYMIITLDDDRKVDVRIVPDNDGKATEMRISFDAEGTNPRELQERGWQAILNNFKAYAERTAQDSAAEADGHEG
jgi:uncharacterized protein YndB with AHSA1/START domain